MGYVYHELITPALLLDNPGVTKEELARLRDNVHEGHYFRGKGEEEQEPWDAYYEIRQPLGLERLAMEMCISEVTARLYPEKDGNGVPIEPTKYWFSFDDEDGREPYEAVVNIINRVREVRRLRIGSLKREFKEGDYIYKWWDDYTGEDPLGTDYSGILIKKILDRREIAKTRKRKSVWNWNDDFKDGYVDFTIEAAIVRQKYFIENFPSEEELFLAWPEISTEKRFDWDQPRGQFYLGYGSHKNFWWVNRGGKYYLDAVTFDRMPVSLISRKWKETNSGNYYPVEIPGYGYTDLILTSEAVRQKAWRIFSYRGKDQLEMFLRDFPDSRPRYEKAVIDAETSWNAKLRGLTHTEFLRMRVRV